VNANISSSETDRLSDSELVGQIKYPSVFAATYTRTLTTHFSSTLIFAGLETVTSAICRILWILACNPSAQVRLRSEIRAAKCASHSSSWEDADLPYNVLNRLPYLDAVVKETLRLHPPTSLLSRTYVIVDCLLLLQSYFLLDVMIEFAKTLLYLYTVPFCQSLEKRWTGLPFRRVRR